MSERILIGVAWPYANGPIHQGQMAGAYLPPDIFARYHRTAGNEVLMVSGSDTHGTPITVRAEREGRSPEEVVAEYHASFLKTWEQMGISFDLFTTTATENTTTTETLMTTISEFTRADSWIPIINSSETTTTMNTAGRLMIPCTSVPSDIFKGSNGDAVNWGGRCIPISCKKDTT